MKLLAPVNLLCSKDFVLKAPRTQARKGLQAALGEGGGQVPEGRQEKPEVTSSSLTYCLVVILLTSTASN